MAPQIGLIFATRNAVQPALDAFARYAPEAGTLLFVDEGLLPAVQREGGVTPALLRRFASLVARAEESGVDGILFSCSVFSPSLSILEPFFKAPVMSVDAAMLQEAARAGGRVGVIATVPKAEELTVAQLRQQAAALGTSLQIRSVAVPEAFAALEIDPARHDALIYEQAEILAKDCDRLVLAQISMARAAPALAHLGLPVLTSLESSVRSIMEKIAGHGLPESAL